MPRWVEGSCINHAEPIDNEGNIILSATNKIHKIKREILPQQYQNILSKYEYNVLNENAYPEYFVYFVYEAFVYKFFISRKKSIDIYRVFNVYLSINVPGKTAIQIPGNEESITKKTTTTIHKRNFPITDNLMFNCHGYTFLNGNFWIGNSQAEKILNTNYKKENNLLKANVLALYAFNEKLNKDTVIHTAKIKNGYFHQKKGDTQGIEKTNSYETVLNSYPKTKFNSYFTRKNKPKKLNISYGDTNKIQGFRIISDRKEKKQFKKLYNDNN